MKNIFLSNIDIILTMNKKDEILKSQNVIIKDGIISEIGNQILPDDSCEIINCQGKVVMPGFVNTHHHLYQTMFRGIDEVQEMPLFPWLIGLYEFWKHLDQETVYYGSMVGFSELLKTGCTTTMDHHYVFPKKSNTNLIEMQFKAADEIGIRFHATRGSMSLGKSQGGLPPDSLVQTETAILEDSQRLIDKFHDCGKYSMKRVALAPCSPFSVTNDLLRESAKLARLNKVMLHTHLAETIDEENFCLDKYGLRPLALMESLGWVGNDVWFAHGIHFNDDELRLLKETGTGIAHCPSSNMKLGSGICRTSECFRDGIKIGIGVDGSASNDGSNMWEEVRRTYLLNHLKYAEKGLSAYETLKMATVGGADVLGRDDIGRIEVGMAADLNIFDLDDICYTGCHNPINSIVSLGNSSYTYMTIVNGKVVSKEGKLVNINEKI